MAQGDINTTVIGNLTAAPELRFTPSGAAVASFTVVSTPRVLDKTTNQWGDGSPAFLDCKVWRDPAEHVAESFDKGTRVIVVGRLKQESWEDKQTQQKRSKFVLEVDEIGPSLRYATAKVQKMSRSGGGGGQQQSQPAQGPADDPWSQSGPGRTAQPASTGSSFDSEPPF